MTPTIDLSNHMLAPAFFRYKADGAVVTVWTGGHVDTNSYYGASRISRAETRPMTLQRGDELHITYGGAFVVRGAESYKLIFTDPESSPFERNTQRPLRFEAHQLDVLTEAEAHRPKGGYQR